MGSIDIATVTAVIAILLNIVSLFGVFIKLERRLTTLETTQKIMMQMFDRRFHGDDK